MRKKQVHLLYKSKYKKYVPKVGTKVGTKLGTFVLQLILANINNTKFNSIGLGLNPSLCQSNSNKLKVWG